MSDSTNITMKDIARDLGVSVATVSRALKDSASSREWAGRLAGTSNIYIAMQHDLKPVGTMAHEFICAIGGLFGPQMGNNIAM